MNNLTTLSNEAPHHDSETYKNVQEAYEAGVSEGWSLRGDADPWIRMRHRKPKIGEYVIVAGLINGEPKTLLNPCCMSESGKFYNQLSGTPIDYEITHWMPLPESPFEMK